MKRLKEGTVSKVSGTSYWKVEEAFFWLIDYEDKNKWMIVVSKGFVTNYWSIPKIFRIIFDPTRYNSYVIHDECYTNKVAYSPILDEYRRVSRSDADKMLLQGITYEWAWFFERLFIYLGVRLWWWIAWNFWKKLDLNDKKNKIE
jgi:hypothetical protein